MNNKPSNWICDVCNESIDDVNNGYVIWKIDENAQSHDFKIVHKTKCDSKEYPASTALREFIGEYGLSKLLANLSLGPISNQLNNGGYCKVADIDAFVDLIRRIHIPFYEEARQNFSNPDVLQDYSDANEILPYLPESLKEIAENY